jgi:hypothetical protein
MNDEGGTLSDLWREERDACMMGGEVGGVIREGLYPVLGSVFIYQTRGARVEAVTVQDQQSWHQ